MIDDLDRCQPDEIIDVLEAVKLFLDVPHVIVVLAVDKDVIDRGIEVRYSKFPFAADRQAALGAEYLEKIIYFLLTLPPLGVTQIGKLFSALDVTGLHPDIAELLSSLVPPNPRKIKRILNMIAMVKAVIADNTELKSLDIKLVARLIVIQVQNGDLFAEVARQPDFLDAIQDYYVNKATKKATNFNRFDANQELYKKLCEKHFSPGSYLAKLFSNT